ncbi:hypothetical protein Bca4012_008554 [Brassica carinata]
MSSEVHVVKGAPEDVKTVNVSVKDVKGEMTKEKVMKKEEENTTIDGGFIKVDKEGIDTKDGEKAEKQVLTERISPSSSQREQRESQGMVKALELELNQELHDLRGKVSEQESINLKLREELKEKEQIHALSKDQEGIIRTENEKLTKVLKEKEVLEASVAEITREAANTKETCNELEMKLKISDEKFSKTDALLSQALSNSSDTEQKLTSLEEKVSQLKSALIVSEEEDKDSARQMQEYQEKVTKLEFSLNQSSARISELEGLLQTSQSELVKAEEKLKSAEERLEKQAREIDEANKRSTEIKDLHKHSDLSIQKAMKDLNVIDTEAKSLTEKSKHLKERIRLYEDKLAEASAHSFSLKHDLDQSSLENALLSDTNNQLKIKIQELEGLLCSEKERFNQRDIEAKDLVAKLQSHENLTEEHKKKVLEASEVADTRQMELEKALLKLKTFEDTIKELEIENGSLAEVNLKLNLELANHGSETSGFQAMLSALEAEEATQKKTQKELEAKNSMILHLESLLLKDLEIFKETETIGEEEVEVKSRDFDLSSPSHSSSSGNVTTQKAETSHLMTLKIVLGVALVSVIIVFVGVFDCF